MSPVRKTGMTVADLKALMAANGVENANQLALALDTHRSVCWKWLQGKTVVTIPQAAFIRSVLKKKPQ